MFRASNGYFWVPIVGPILGGIIGVWLYQCYATIIANYGQFSNPKHENSAEIGLKTRNTMDDMSELRQRLTTAPDSIS